MKQSKKNFWGKAFDPAKISASIFANALTEGQINSGLSKANFYEENVEAYRHEPLKTYGNQLKRSTTIFFTRVLPLTVGLTASFLINPMLGIGITTGLAGFSFARPDKAKEYFSLSKKVKNEDTQIESTIQFADKSFISKKELKEAFDNIKKKHSLESISLYITDDEYQSFNAYSGIPKTGGIFISTGTLNSIIRQSDDNKEFALEQIKALLTKKVGSILKYHNQKVAAIALSPLAPLSTLFISIANDKKVLAGLSFIGTILTTVGASIMAPGIGRINDYESDEFAANNGYREPLIEAIKSQKSLRLDYPSNKDYKSAYNSSLETRKAYLKTKEILTFFSSSKAPTFERIEELESMDLNNMKKHSEKTKNIEILEKPIAKLI